MNDIDLLMQRIEEINAKTPPLDPEDIDTIIAYHRLCRARKAAGEKPTKAKVDLASILGPLIAKKPEPAKEEKPFKIRLNF